MPRAEDYNGYQRKMFLRIKEHLKQARSGFTEKDADSILAGTDPRSLDILLGWTEAELDAVPWNIFALDILKDPIRLVKQKADEIINKLNPASPIPASLSIANVMVFSFPVIPEWRYGSASILIFTKLDSCLGIVGTTSNELAIMGFHLSMYSDPKCEEQKFAALSVKLSKLSRLKNFGGTLREWEGYFNLNKSLSNPFNSKNEITPVPNDKNQRKWLFWKDRFNKVNCINWV